MCCSGGHILLLCLLLILNERLTWNQSVTVISSWSCNSTGHLVKFSHTSILTWVRIDPDLGLRGARPISESVLPGSVSMCPGIRVKIPVFKKICCHNDTDSGSHWHGFRVKRTQKWVLPLGLKSGTILTRVFRVYLNKQVRVWPQYWSSKLQLEIKLMNTKHNCSLCVLSDATTVRLQVWSLVFDSNILVTQLFSWHCFTKFL